MTSKAATISERALRVFDGLLLRLDDAMDFARAGATRLLGRAVRGGASPSSIDTNLALLPPDLVHVDDLGIDVADPVDAHRALQLRQDRLSPIDPSLLEWALGWSDETKSWKVGMIRHAELARLDTEGGAGWGAATLGLVCMKDGARFVFRRPVEQTAWRRFRGLTLVAILALAAAFLGLAAAFDARSARVLDLAQAERARVLAGIRDIPDIAPTTTPGMAPHELIARLDLVAAARPDAWHLLSVRQSDSGWTLLFDIPDQAGQGFVEELQISPAVVSVSARQLGVRNGVTRREVQIVWQEVGQ